MFLKSTEGEYLPSFFIIRLKTNEPIIDYRHEDDATFTHEYIHLLQDWLLPYCMRDNLIYLATFLETLKIVHDAGEIKLPQNILLDGKDITTLQSDFTWGSNLFIPSVNSLSDITTCIKYVPEHGFNLYKYKLSLDDGQIYHFGARDFLEYIAYKIESKHFVSQQELPDLPYKSIDIILEHHQQGKKINDVKRIALAEYCLLNDNPAHRLMVILSEINREEWGDIEEVTDGEFISQLKKSHWKSAGVQFETIQDKLARRHKQLLQLLQEKYPKKEFPDISSWIENTINYMRDNFLGTFLFSQLYQMTTDEFKATFNEITNKIGIPLLINNQDELKTFLNDTYNNEQFIQLLLTYEFSEYLNRSDPQCPLCSTCERERPEIMNEDCLDAPFRRADLEPLCPFGVFAKSHGLAELRWYASDRLILSQGSGFPNS